MKNKKEKGSREGGEFHETDQEGDKIRGEVVTELRDGPSRRAVSEGEPVHSTSGARYGGCGQDSGSLPRLGTNTLERKDSRRRSWALESNKYTLILTA